MVVWLLDSQHAHQYNVGMQKYARRFVFALMDDDDD
jgi:hypothetical protein